MKLANRRWPYIAVGVGFLSLGFLHLIAWSFLIFVYHGTANAKIARTFLPVYGLLGIGGTWLFGVTIVLDVIAGLLLLASRQRGRMLVFLTSILNLPILPLGPLVGAAGLLMVFATERARP